MTSVPSQPEINASRFLGDAFAQADEQKRRPHFVRAGDHGDQQSPQTEVGGRTRGPERQGREVKHPREIER